MKWFYNLFFVNFYLIFGIIMYCCIFRFLVSYFSSLYITAKSLIFVMMPEYLWRSQTCWLSKFILLFNILDWPSNWVKFSNILLHRERFFTFIIFCFNKTVFVINSITLFLIFLNDQIVANYPQLFFHQIPISNSWCWY